MKEKDKQEVQTEPVKNSTEPETTNTNTENTQGTTQPNEEESTGDYAIVESGLGIDE